MSLKIFHTADVHLGMKFAGYPEVQTELSEARFTTLENLVERASSEQCDLFVVAGDLFDRISIAKPDVLKAAQILSQFQGRLVSVLPGNHDYISSGQSELWTTFKGNIGDNDNVLVLEEKKIYPLEHYDLDVNLYPAPCDAKNSSENYVGWIKETLKDKGVKYHIGIAHGSLEGVSPDFEKSYYPMTRTDLLDCEVDLWLMGHTDRIQLPGPGDYDLIFYPSTPEPNGFDCKHEGKAWIIELDEDKKIQPTSISTGQYRFFHDEVEVKSGTDLAMLKTKYSEPTHTKTLLKLKLKGRLPRDEYNSLRELKEEIENQLFHLQEWDDSEVTEEITLDAIDSEFTQESFPHKLLSKLAEEEDFESLQIAYDLIQKVRE